MTYKSILLSTAMLFLVASVHTMAQDKKEKKEIIIKGNDKGEQMVIVVDGDKVTLNGKEITGDDNKRVMIMKRPLTTGQWKSFGRDTIIDFSGETKAQLGVMARIPENGTAGAEVTEVSPGSAAIKAGIKAKDIIQSVAGKKITSPEELVAAIRAHKPGDAVTLELLRDGNPLKVQATLGEAPAGAILKEFKFEGAPGLEGILEEIMQDGPGRPMLRQGMPMPARKPRLGVQLEETESGKGLKVLEVSPDSPADKAGIKENDIILHIGGKEVDSIASVRQALDSKESEVQMDISRGGKHIDLSVKLPKPLKRGSF
jgi:serine protease Do